MEPRKFVFIVPKYKPVVTIDYVQWWEPYLLGCAVALAKARKMKEHPLLVSPRKRKIDVPPNVSPKRVGNGAKEKATELSFEVPVGSDATNTGSNKALGAIIVADMHSTEVLFDIPIALSTPEDVVVISDDDNEDEVCRMHQKLPQLETTPSSLEEQNTESQIISASSNAQYNRVMKDVRVPKNCDHETDIVRNNIVLREEPFEVLDVDTVQPGFNLLDTPTEKMKTCPIKGQIDKGDMVEKENWASLEGNNYSSGLADVNTQLEHIIVCTRTLYYLRPFWLSKHDQNKDVSDTTTDEETFQPRREIGTLQMIEEAFAARYPKTLSCKKVIDHLKEEIVALEVQREDRCSRIT
uniref:Uncharacterized protein n=1 Tax=Oryza punctata TaxID=4537 RepID=A0A0E0KFL7_ORYPU